MRGTAAVLSERLRTAVEETLNGDLAITISIGYAPGAGAFENAEKFFEAADAALYAAKQQAAIAWGLFTIAATATRKSRSVPLRTRNAGDGPHPFGAGRKKGKNVESIHENVSLIPIYRTDTKRCALVTATPFD